MRTRVSSWLFTAPHTRLPCFYPPLSRHETDTPCGVPPPHPAHCTENLLARHRRGLNDRGAARGGDEFHMEWHDLRDFQLGYRHELDPQRTSDHDNGQCDFLGHDNVPESWQRGAC